MANILYITNCSRGFVEYSHLAEQSTLHRDPNKFVNIPALRDPTRKTYPNLTHELCQLGHKVNVINPYGFRNSIIKRKLDKRVNIVQDEQLNKFFKLLFGLNFQYESFYLPYPNIYMIPTIAKIHNFNQYDCVLYDGGTEYLTLDTESWRRILIEIKYTRSIWKEIMDDSLGFEEVLKWIESPNADSSVAFGLKTFHTQSMLAKLRSNLDQLTNFYYVTGYNFINGSHPCQELFNFLNSETITTQQKFDNIYSPALGTPVAVNFQKESDIDDEFSENHKVSSVTSRLHCYRFYSADFFEQLVNLADRLQPPFLSCVCNHIPENNLDSIFQLSNRTVSFSKELVSPEEYEKYFCGVAHFSKAGLETLADVIDEQLI